MPRVINFTNLNVRRQPVVRPLRPIRNFAVNNLVDGVLEGGGALGTAYVGALQALHENGIWFQRIAGNSAGAITAAMIAVGFTAPEIQWLSSAFPNSPTVPNSLSSVGITTPISFADFLDLPNINSISQSSKRKTLLWQSLNSSILDEIGKFDLPIPTQSAAVDACVSALKADKGPLGAAAGAGETIIRRLLNGILAPLPDNQNNKPKIKDLLPNTTVFRAAFADTLWDAIGRNDPLLLLMTNLMHEAGLFEGDVFLRKIRNLFGSKINNNPNSTVLFKHLQIPLAVIASNVKTGEMIVYNSKDHPNFEVAEAVRQSMSVPFAFQARGAEGQFVDGGLCSNFPIWLYSAGGDRFWDPSVIDSSRLKIGFSLNETAKAKQQWNSPPARFVTAGNPPRVNNLQVAKPILVEKMVEIGVPRSVAEDKITWALFGAAGNGTDPGIKLLSHAIDVMVNGFMNTEESVRKVMIEGLMSNRPYIDISIPMLGFSGADFFINEDENDVFSMWDRAWQAAVEALADGKSRGVLNTGTLQTQTPFN